MLRSCVPVNARVERLLHGVERLGDGGEEVAVKHVAVGEVEWRA